MKESEIEKILVKETKKLGGAAYKWESPGNDGVPDRIVIFPGKEPIFVELKTEKGRLSELQKVQLTRLIDLDQQVEVLYGLEDVALFFRQEGYAETAERIRKRKEQKRDKRYPGI